MRNSITTLAEHTIIDPRQDRRIVELADNLYRADLMRTLNPRLSDSQPELGLSAKVNLGGLSLRSVHVRCWHRTNCGAGISTGKCISTRKCNLKRRCSTMRHPIATGETVHSG